jgi:hypothetical protein
VFCTDCPCCISNAVCDGDILPALLKASATLKKPDSFPQFILPFGRVGFPNTLSQVAATSM